MPSPNAYPFAIFGGAWAGAMDGRAYPSKGDTVVGNDVWLGHRATVLPGVTIGHGAIVGTAAVVTKDVAPYAVVGGNPARELRRRFDEATVARLLALAWWDWDVARITRNLHALTGGDVDAVVA